MKHPTFMLFLSIFFFLFPHSLALPQPHFNNLTDQAALLSFKSHVTDDPTRLLDTWNTSTSFCSWHGVSCNPRKNRVTALALGNLTLTGTINPYITNLSFLHILDLQSNNFHGSIPSDIGKLFRLEILILATNKLEGLIPSSLGDSSRLLVLDLSENQLEGSIPSELANLHQLQDVSFAKNNLAGPIPSWFGNLSSLNNLIFLSNKLYGPIPDELGHLNQLLQLHIADNNISGEIPASVFNISSLIILSLAKNQLTGELPFDMLNVMPSLTYLFLGGNLFRGHIPPSLSNATTLERLDLSKNQFTGQVPLLWNLKNIQILNLEFNQLESKGQQGLNFITSLANSTNLQVFSIATNQFSGKLPSSIGTLSKNLSLLEIGENNFQGNMPESIGDLSGLTLLSAESNSFSGRIPSTFGNLGNLQSLTLDWNSFSGSIPPSFGNLSQLFKLGLSGNNLTGGVPLSLSNCQHLQQVDLSSNNLNGDIPKEIFNFPSLGKLLNFSWNSFTGNLSSEIGNLKMVQQLDFSNNHLSGEIPSTIGGCSNLLYLDLSSNSFQGVIPSSFSHIKGIEHIDLSSNNLSGTIPPLGTLQYLGFLNLSANELQGEVPKKGIFLNTSGVFLGKNSELCGGIAALKLSNCAATTRHSGRSRKARIEGIAAGSVAICILSVLLIFIIVFSKRHNKRQSISADAILVDAAHKLYSYYDLKTATNDFSSDKLIGTGSFGYVYKGVLGDGTLAAIKVFNMDQIGAFKSFHAECEALRNIRHRNLVKIISACSSATFKALILAYVPNGSLERWLHHQWEERKEGLSLEQRLNIAIDVASAMEYLHHDCEPPLVHCDLKPSNILLDQDMTAHVGDFGLARMLHGTVVKGHTSSTIGLKGSIGYIAPEYGFGGQASRKGDVYSYGIVLLEMLTGKRPTEQMFSGEMNLQTWVEAALPDGVLGILDDELVKSCKSLSRSHMVSLMQIGISCASVAVEVRPEMREVSAMITRTKGLVFADFN